MSEIDQQLFEDFKIIRIKAKLAFKNFILYINSHFKSINFIQYPGNKIYLKYIINYWNTNNASDILTLKKYIIFLNSEILLRDRDFIFITLWANFLKCMEEYDKITTKIISTLHEIQDIQNKLVDILLSAPDDYKEKKEYIEKCKFYKPCLVVSKDGKASIIEIKKDVINEEILVQKDKFINTLLK